MNFIAVHVTCPEELSEIILAELSLFPFDTFEEHDHGVSAFCEENVFTKEMEVEIRQSLGKYDGISFTTQVLPRENWNEEWEKHYEPVIVKDQIIVRASFHDPETIFPYELIITPKMSFGTGHHATTHLMLEEMLSIDFKEKRVADFGSGTGVLAIMAHKLGAKSLLATDVDDWCIENCIENFELNHVPDVKTLQGPIKELDLKGETYDIILANINKNILLEEMEAYIAHLENEGYLFLSGFYQHDIQDLLAKAPDLGMKKIKESTKSDWAVLVLQKAR